MRQTSTSARPGAAVLALLASSALAWPALADEEAATLRGVVVTGKKEDYAVKVTESAAKLPLSLRQTPQSVTVVTQQRMEDFGLTTLANVLEQTTGITVQENDSSRVNFSARGFSISNFQFDGAPTSYASGSSAMGDTALYERVEVVRGAAGLVTGAGDPSATVNLIRKRPTPEFSARGALTLGSWSRGRIEADVSGPLGLDGRVRGRLTGAFEDRESHLDLYQEKKSVALAVLEADLTDTTLIRLGYDYLEVTPKGTTWGTAPLYYRDGTPTALPRSYNVAANWSTWDRNTQNLYGVLQQDLPGDWSARLTINRREGESTALLFYGYGGYPDRKDGSGLIVADYYNVYQEEETSYDLFASGPFNLFGRQHEAVIGVNGYEREGTTLNDQIDAARRPYDLAIPDFRTWDGRIPRPNLLQYGTPAQIVTTRETGLYGALRLNPHDRLKVIAGARNTRWETRTDRFNLAGVYTTSANRYSDERLTPYLGAIFDLTGQVSAYASYADLFKPQSSRDRNDRQLDPVVGANYEVGLKGEFLDARLLASVTGFYVQQDNLATLDPGVPDGFRLPDGSQAYIAVSGAKTRGFEAEATGRVGEAWSIVGGYTYAYTENAAGERISTLHPRHIARIYANYRFSGVLEGLTMGGGLNWQSEIYTLATIPVAGNTSASGTTPPTQRVNVTQDPYVLANLMARYQLNARSSLQLNIDNLFDETYYRRVGFYNGGYYGDPRKVTLTLRAAF